MTADVPNPEQPKRCPHGFDLRYVQCQRCADPAFDSARGGEIAAAAAKTFTGTVSAVGSLPPQPSSNQRKHSFPKKTGRVRNQTLTFKRHINVHADEETYWRLRKWSQALSMSMSQFIRAAVLESIQEHERMDREYLYDPR